jgi:hypothetical protein
MEQDVTVDNILDVGWPGAPLDDGLPIVCKLGVASSDNKCKVDDQNPNKNNTKVSFTVFSENGATCEIDTGDGKKEVCNTISHTGSTPNITTVSHTYTEAGNYIIKKKSIKYLKRVDLCDFLSLLHLFVSNNYDCKICFFIKLFLNRRSITFILPLVIWIIC